MNINNKKILIGFIIAFVLGLNIYNIPLKGQDSQTIITESVQMETAKAFNVNRLNDILNQTLKTPVDFSSYKKVIISFWATWCPSCRLENTIFNRVIDDYKNELLIIAVSVDKSVDAYQAYLSENSLKFQTVLQNPNIAEMFDDILAVPTHYIIDVDSNKVRKSMGVMDENEIKNIVKEKL